MTTLINNIKKDRGFTIVELLVVIVVIGILAAITIVSYTGITQKANTTRALSNAQSAQNVAEIIAADNGGVYPATTGAFTTGSTTSKLPGGVTVLAGTAGLTSATGTTSVTWECKNSCASNIDGGRIRYWDFSLGAMSTTVVYVGTATSTDTYVNPAS